MPIKREGCVAYDDPLHYRTGKRYELVGEMASMEWVKKIAWDKIDWVSSISREQGGYYVRTNVMNDIRKYMGDADPFPDREWRQAMLLKIPAGGTLIIHNDGNFLKSEKYPNAQTFERYHLPIFTNDGCKCYLHRIGTDPEEFDAYHCEVGKLYVMDPTIYHYSENLGSTDRIHLCVDLKVHL